MDTKTLNFHQMKQEDCNVLLYEISLEAAKDYKAQGGKWVDYKMCRQAHEHFPDWISATSLRTAKTAARAIKANKIPNQLTKCSAIDGFLAFLFHRVQGYKFPSVKKLIQNKGREYLRIVETEPSPYQPPVPPSVFKQPLGELAKDGNFGDKLIRLGEHVKKLEDEISKKNQALKRTKSHLELLIEKNDDIKSQRERDQKTYSEALAELEELLNQMENDARELKGESLKRAKRVISELKQKILFYKSK